MATTRTGAGPEPALPLGHLRPGCRHRGPPRAQDSSGFFEPPGPLPGRAAFLFLLRRVRGRSAVKVPSPPCPCGLSAGPEPAIPTRDPGCGPSPRPACGWGPHRARPAPRKAQPRGPADSRRERVVCRGPRQTDGPRPGPLDLPLRPHSASSASAAPLSPGLGGGVATPTSPGCCGSSRATTGVGRSSQLCGSRAGEGRDEGSWSRPRGSGFVSVSK